MRAFWPTGTHPSANSTPPNSDLFLLCKAIFSDVDFIDESSDLDTSSMIYHCTQTGCPLGFTSKEFLVEHVRKEKHSEHVCSLGDCSGRHFISPEALELHQNRIHATYLCPEPGCSQTCPSYKLLQQHEAEHSRELVNNQGQATHTATTIFKCKTEKCGKEYTILASFKAHEKTHEKPFKCDQQGCSKRFARRNRLTDHRKTHSKDSLFHCSVCNKNLSSPDAFKKHKKRCSKKVGRNPGLYLQQWSNFSRRENKKN
jgi:Zinc finger, C2H2 type